MRTVVKRKYTAVKKDRADQIKEAARVLGMKVWADEYHQVYNADTDTYGSGMYMIIIDVSAGGTEV